MKRSLVRIASAAALCFAAFAVAPQPSAAQSRPASQHVLSRGAPDASALRRPASAPGAEHVLFGRIDGIHGAMLLLRLRNTRVQRIDYSDALRSGAYSEPLFIGKIVEVRGAYDTSRTLHAVSVMRMGQLDAGTARDR